jgi:hypothetical protein
LSRFTRHGSLCGSLVTGGPRAEVVPAGPDRKRKFLGDMIGTAEIVGDITSPIIDLDEIEAYHD